MKRAIGASVAVLLVLGVAQAPAFAGLGANKGNGCGGFGSIGPKVGAGAGCGGGATHPGGTTTTTSADSSTTGGATAPSNYWEPSDNDWGYASCPNKTGPNIPSALQEYNPKGFPIGFPIVVCPGAGGLAGMPGPPPPPTPGEVWSQVPLPTAALYISPAQVGITQLPSWFWISANAGQPLVVTAQMGDYSITTEASPVGYQWEFGDGASASNDNVGSPTDPSVTHTYNAVGTYPVSLTVVYGGSYTYVGPMAAVRPRSAITSSPRSPLPM